jgi:dipeptidase D
MSNNILQLNPPAVWKHFYSLTQIPRPSGKEEQIREFIADFGKNLGLETLVDDVGNVIIRKPATSGMENRQGVILQGHLDMVPQKNSYKQHDFETDPIEMVVDGEWVMANGTTLGADNGLGVAAAMAVLESGDIQHGPLEALFTSNEEAGMTGATGLKPGMLKGKILINMDSEDEGALVIGCAGGTNAKMTFRYNEQPLSSECMGFRIKVTGLKGGHSGVDIHLGRGNANKIMNRILYHGNQYGLQLASIDGGSLRNAIPRESFVHIAIPVARVGEFLNSFTILTCKIKNELSGVEPSLQIDVIAAGLPESVIKQDIFINLLNAIYACPNGVIRMSNEMDGLVETSNNLALVKSGNGVITIECLLRSSVDSARDDLEIMIKSLFGLAGVVSVFDGAYPGWKPNQGSPILKTMQAIYTMQFGNVPEITAIHAGLECGILGGAYPELDMISFGPTIRYPHSPDEKVNIPSVLKFWEFLVETLRNIPLDTSE